MVTKAPLTFSILTTRPADNAPAMPKVPGKPAALEGNGNGGDEFGEPPALYIAQYGRLIDTRYIKPPPPPLPPETEDQDRLTELGRKSEIIYQIHMNIPT